MVRKGFAKPASGLILLFGLCATSTLAQPEYSGSVNLFGSANHSVREGDHNWGLGLGVGIDVGARETRGSHSYNLGYGASRIQGYRDGYSDVIRLNGRAGYRFVARNGRFDANANHGVTTSNRSGLIYFDPDDFSTQNQISAGAGLNQRLGALTTARLSGQVGATFNEDSAANSQSASSQLAINRRLSERSTAGANVSRSYGLTDYETVTSTTDTAQGTYSRILSNGSLNLAAGMTWANTDNSEFTAATGSAVRTWVGADRQFSLTYNRSVSSTVLDLTVLQLNEPAEDETEFTLTEEDIQVSDLSLSDQVGVQYRSGRLCELCTYSLSLSSARVESLTTQQSNYQHQFATRLGYQIDPLQSANINYSLAITTDKLTEGPWNRRQQVSLGWQRQLAENVQATGSASHSWLGGEQSGRRTDVRFGVAYGWF